MTCARHQRFIGGGRNTASGFRRPAPMGPCFGSPSFVQTMRGGQRVVAGQAYAIVSRAAAKADEFIGDSPRDPATAISLGDEYANHFARAVVNAFDRTGADDRAFGNRTQEKSAIGVHGFRVVDVRQTRINEIPYKGVRVIMKMLAPNSFDETPSSRRIAGLERPNHPICLVACLVRGQTSVRAGCDRTGDRGTLDVGSR